MVGSDPSLDFITSVINSEWEYLFAKQLSEQYSCTIWLPSLVLLLHKIGASTWNDELFMQLIVSMHFVLEKLLDAEIAFKIDAGEDSDMIQVHLFSMSLNFPLLFLSKR
jgi:U3 small nucleolar RNA-associated protein 10